MRVGRTFSTMTDPEGVGPGSKGKRRLAPSRQKLQKRLRIGSAFGLAFGRLEKLERDRSLADGRLKHQRTDRTINMFLTCPLGSETGTDLESLVTGLK